jgi:hypothetical protein
MEGKPMLTYEKLVELERSLRGEWVLSVYVDGDVTDPVGRTRWRHALERALDRTRATLDRAPAAQRTAFDRCVARVSELLPPSVVSLYPPGWVAFIGPDAVHHVGSLHVAAPTLVVWQTGIRVGPYVRALKQHQPAVAAVVDSTGARVYRYIHGALERVETLHAHARLDRPEHMGDPPPSGFHSGTRGRTATDEAERVRRAGRASMMRRLASRLMELAGDDSWILLGGADEAVSELTAALPKPMLRHERVRVMPELDAHATDARVAAAAERGAMLQRRARDLMLIDEVIDRSASGGKGAVGSEATLRAVRDGAADRLFFTERFLHEHPDDTEELVRAAFDKRAQVEQASGDAAVRLDAAGGVGARLRYGVGVLSG